jgi:hypothetical protein
MSQQPHRPYVEGMSHALLVAVLMANGGSMDFDSGTFDLD